MGVEPSLTCDKAQFMQSLSTMKKMDSFTYTGDALEVAAKEYASHGRHGDYRAVILITDGVPCTQENVLTCDDSIAAKRVQAAKAQKMAAALKADGADIISIAVGDFGQHGLQFIEDISSSPSSKYVFNPSSWEKLPDLINSIIASVCPPSA